jgi:hypothetical protein
MPHKTGKVVEEDGTAAWFWDDVRRKNGYELEPEAVREPYPNYNPGDYVDVLKPGCRFIFDSDEQGFLGRPFAHLSMIGSVQIRVKGRDPRSISHLLDFLKHVVSDKRPQHMIWAGVLVLRRLNADAESLFDLAREHQTTAFLFPAAAQVGDDNVVFMPTLTWQDNADHCDDTGLKSSLGFIEMSERVSDRIRFKLMPVALVCF